jgi:uncharacterized protein YjbJ (UPF0337 family)
MPKVEPMVSARRPSASKRRGRSVSRVGATGLALVLAFAFGMQPAQACSAPDPCVDETVDQVDATVAETVPDDVEETGGTVEGTVDGTVGRVEETVGAVEDTATGVVDKVEEIVNGVLGGGGSPEPDPEPRGGGPAGNTVPAGSALGGAASRPPGHGGGGAARPRLERPYGPTAILHDPAASVAASLTAPGSELGPAISSQPMERWGGLLDLPAPVLAFPVVLAIVVLLFVAVQNRLDRRDPRLALASMLPEVVRFD